MTDESGALEPGDIVSERYRITAKLGEGGFASTYSAHDLRSNQLVAVKALSLAHVGDWKTVELFRREANVLRALDHPQIPDYIDFVDVEADRSGYLVQTLAPGKSLSALLAEGRRFAQQECLDIARQVLGILDYLSALRPPVVHRDIKPANLLLDDSGRIRLVDFGAVRELAEDSVSGSTMIGSLSYMAPEQLRGQATCASDIFGLGMTLVHLLTGTDPAELPKRRLKPDIRGVLTVAPAFEFVLNKMLEVVPEDRVKDASEALELLGDAAVIVDPRAESDDPIDSLVHHRDEERAELARDSQKALVTSRAAIARRRADQRGATEIITGEGGLTLAYQPRLYRRLRYGTGVGVVLGSIGFLACSAAIVLAVYFDLHGAVIANISVWAGLFGLFSAVWAVVSVRGVLSQPLRLRVTPHGNFMVYRNEKKPLGYGAASELSISVRPAGADQEFGSVSITSEHERWCLDRLTDRDIAVFQQFVELTGGED